MADNNSKKYLSGDNLKYTLQQLKTKLDETYSTFEYVDDSLPSIEKFKLVSSTTHNLDFDNLTYSDSNTKALCYPTNMPTSGNHYVKYTLASSDGVYTGTKQEANGDPITLKLTEGKAYAQGTLTIGSIPTFFISFNRTITFNDDGTFKQYSFDPNTSMVFCRFVDGDGYPRQWTITIEFYEIDNNCAAIKYNIPDNLENGTGSYSLQQVGNSATGSNSVALGKLNEGPGYLLGSSNKATGTAISIGKGNNSTGPSYVLGEANTVASGFAIGMNNKAAGVTTVVGNGLTSTTPKDQNKGSMIIGAGGTLAQDTLFAISTGLRTANTSTYHTVRYPFEAKEDGTTYLRGANVVLESENAPSADNHLVNKKYVDDAIDSIDTDNLVITNSISMGRKEDTSIGEKSVAVGYDVEASGAYSHAEGFETIASGEFSHAEGDNTTASGYASHAEGCETKASEINSHAEGYHTIASSVSQHVQGEWNIEDAENTYVHIVGNGIADDNRSNAHTLDWDGNAWYAGDVHANNVPYCKEDVLLNVAYDDYEFAFRNTEPRNVMGRGPVLSPGTIGLIVGEEYIVEWNNERFLVTATQNSDTNPQLAFTMDFGENGKTEVKIIDMLTLSTPVVRLSYKHLNQVGTITDNLIVKKESINYLDSKFLPDTVATKEYVDENKFSGDYNDLENKPVSIINFNTDFVDAVATHSEAYKVDTIAFSQSITVDDSYEYFAEAKYTDGTVVTKPLELAETNYRICSKINAKAVVGSFDGNVIDTNNQIGYVTSLIPIKYYNNKISICKKSNQSWYDFNLLVVDENLTITNIYTHDSLPTVDSLPSTAAYFAIYNYYTSSITDVDYLFSGDVTDGGLYIKIGSDIKNAGVCIFLERSEEGNSVLSNTEYTICEATSNYVLQNRDLGLYIADSMDVIYPAAYSETFVANDTGFASAMLIMNYSNISSIRVYTKNILVNAENKALATKEYVNDAVMQTGAYTTDLVFYFDHGYESSSIGYVNVFDFEPGKRYKLPKQNSVGAMSKAPLCAINDDDSLFTIDDGSNTIGFTNLHDATITVMYKTTNNSQIILNFINSIMQVMISVVKTDGKYSATFNTSNVTQDYHRATKKYVDDAIAANSPTIDEDELDAIIAEVYGQ